MDIRCRKTSCENNKMQTCQSKKIYIEKKCNCATFLLGQNNKVDTSKKIFSDEVPKYARQRDTKTMEIFCKAECLFNKDGKCTANGVTINDLKGAYCISFIQK